LDLVLIRHARAFDRDSAAWPDDSRRPLTESGREEFRLLAKRLGKIVPDVDLLESSAYVRAWQTAQILAEETGWPKPTRLERLEAAGDSTGESIEPDRIESLARALSGMRGIDAVAWVGHEPMLSRLASRLITGSAEGMRIDFKKGAALALRIKHRTERDGTTSGLSAGAEILWMITPRLVRRMRRSSR
jgi:phosphohistidine phosphatase